MDRQQKQQQVMRGKRGRGSSSGGGRREKDVGLGMKVVYISTPMKVKTSASKFREIVQELTGRESDVVRIMESNGGRDTWTVLDQHPYHGYNKGLTLAMEPDHSSRFSPSSSEEDLVGGNEPFDGFLVRGQEGNFEQFDSNLLYDQFCHQLDVLGSY